MLQKYLRFLEKNQLLQHETTQVITLDEFTFAKPYPGTI